MLSQIAVRKLLMTRSKVRNTGKVVRPIPVNKHYPNNHFGNLIIPRILASVAAPTGC